MADSSRFGDLDRWLTHPDRLLIAVALADKRWHKSGEIRDVLGMRPDLLSSRLAPLHRARYVERKRDGARTTWRLTSTGSDRLAAHLAALQIVLSKVTKLVGGSGTPRPRTSTNCPRPQPGREPGR
ncbi:transcriptional regulator [Amycolatopsis sp. NBC_00345]|uniref:transcriptional regulator n=1 Tax=Amycolatopsis sp. NBC_00345 TaxID=2975955 RepID=UPI003FA4B6B6